MAGVTSGWTMTELILQRRLLLLELLSFAAESLTVSAGAVPAVPELSRLADAAATAAAAATPGTAAIAAGDTPLQ
jgi:hypothetical protein